MSWRGRDDRTTRWGDVRGRSPVWEMRRSESPDRRMSPPRDRRDLKDRRDRHDRYDRDRRDRDAERYTRRDPRERYDKPRERDQHRELQRRRSPRRFEDKEVPAPPSPPVISADVDKTNDSHSSSRSGSRERIDSIVDSYDSKYDREKHDDIHSVNASPGDWICKCGSYNFKRRQICYRRNCQGKRSEGVIYGGDSERTNVIESNGGITKRLLFRRLDALTTEEKILESIKDRCSKSVLDSIAGITIGRETLTGASKCLAYINFNSIADSTSAHSQLLALDPPLKIDSREVLISFYNEPQKPPKSLNSNSNDYSSYYSQVTNFNTSQAMSEADRVNAAAAVAQSAISAAQARNMTWAAVLVPSAMQNANSIKAPTGDGKTVYSAPDVRTFLYDESSGYYYDPATSLYYDGNTQYFYNSQINQYMYWDASSATYIAAVQNLADQTIPSVTVAEIIKEPEEKKKKEKDDKVKVAKKIAKDMERWARTLNQKKENAKSNIVMEQPLDTSTSKGSADIGFSVLGAGPALTLVRELSPPPVSTDDFLIKKPECTPLFDIDEGIIDWPKLTCLICKRRFPSVEVLNKHKTISELHKQNLAEFRKKNDLLPQSNGYRDRAAERRLKFGEDEPVIRKRYEPPEIHAPVVSHPPPSVVDTIGGKMLQKMGWSEGRGLGKEEQGRIAPIEAEQRPSLAGLGQKRGIYTPTPGLTYRDTVKKLMIARYKEVVGQEDGK